MTVEQSADDLLSPDVFQRREHHQVFAHLRAVDPVHWHVDGAGVGFWSLTKHADVQMANRDTLTFCNSQGFTLRDIDPDDMQGAIMKEMLPGMDAPAHTRFRRIVNRGFTPRTLRLIEDHLARQARTIVDRVIGRGQCDFVTDIAAALPLQAIAELVGVPDDDRRQVFEWGNALTGIDDPEFGGDLEAGMAASAEMIAYADGLRRDRQAHPRPDVMTTLTNATTDADGGRLSEAELGLFFLLLVVAGNETTRNATAHGMRALIEHPDQLRVLSAGPSRERIERAVDEILRWSSPIHYFRRTATRDVELRGRTIKEGDRVVLWYASANRDEEAFVDPFRFDVGRTPNDHVSFGGGGAHFCLGANLARMELRLIFTELVARLGTMTLAGDVEMLRSNFIAGIKHMPVRWEIPGSP
ncbi:MAG: cytochrome P450 [Acidimicrobiales bacterium]